MPPVFRTALITSLIGASLAVSSCTTMAMNGLNGIGICPPDAIANASTFWYTVSNARAGDDAVILESLAPPEKVQRLTMPEGSALQLRYYRTGHPRCRNMPTDEEFTPVLIGSDGQGGSRIVAIGADQVQTFRNRSSSIVTQQDSTPSGMSFSDVLMGRF